MGVGPREIGYFYGQYKRLNPYEPGVLTGKTTCGGLMPVQKRQDMVGFI